MAIHIKSTAQHLDYIASNEKGHSIQINGDGNGVAPMQTLLSAVAACSAVDVEIFLSKMRQNLRNLEIKVTGERAENVTPRPFTSIHIHFILYGDIKESSAKKAVSMAVEKYCSVAKSLNPNIPITHDFEIVK